ncbi:ABC-type nitrate/sulfonate/bicarbonate transport system, permease component [Dehalogenimonas alkenigignens]|uniref:ABC-type nitrate/sulfonate/bicarbonate transport system, permease component n=1 Tax=Dehalogenimonas alkenigignens TaxID=1217799 RepID=A0A0W0GL87_9CHLR|nr:ABC transporter permease [Dehalogenimonas alkenigignens]KTB49301.1 ABC-type nitrate/sulfonate/bicarbonate transport system, permease component [Dehalogenimonas alkenigignens]
MVTREILGSNYAATTSIRESQPQQMGKRWRLKFPVGLMLPILLLGIWWLGAATGNLKVAFFSTPQAVLETLWKLLINGELVEGFWDTLRRILAGAAIGFSAGAVLGGITGYVRQIERVLDPTIQGLRAVPAVAWIPFLILTLGIDDGPKIALISIAIFFITYVNTYAGVRGTDQKLIELANAYRLRRSLIIRRLIIPSALPQVFVGLRLAAAIAWIAAVFSEILIGSSGLGVLLNDGRSLGRPDQTIALMLVLAAAGKTTDGLIKLLEKRVTGWRTTFAGV